jgi:hypothetical protein
VHAFWTLGGRSRAVWTLGGRSRAGLAAFAALLVVILATLSSSLIGGKVFSSGDLIYTWPPFTVEHPANWVRPSDSLFGDAVLGFIPDTLQTRADINNGVAPLWNPYAGAGRPLLASQVHAPVFPIAWLAFLLPFWSSLAWIAAAKLLLAAGGTYLLCRELRLRRGPSLLGAITFPFGGYYFAWMEHPQTYVWAMLPWMLLATRRASRTGSLGAAALLGGAAGLSWLGGHPESAAFLLGTTVAYGAFELIAERRAGPPAGANTQRWSGPGWTETIQGRAGLLIGALALGIGVGAIVNIPLFELLGQSPSTNRGGSAFPFSQGWAFFFPELWGNPSKAFAQYGSDWAERTTYIGAMPLLFALGSVGRRRPREQWFFVATAIILLATVYNTPLWADGVRKLPGGSVAALGRLLIVVSLSGAVLAAYGLQRWITGTRQERRRMLRIMGIAALLPVLLWLPRHLDLMSSLSTALKQLPAVHHGVTSPRVYALASVWRWIVVCGLGLGALVLAERRRAPKLAIVLVVALTAVDLVALDRGFHGSIPLNEANPPVPAAITYLRQHEGHARFTASAALPANLGERYGLRDPRVGIDIPHPTRYDKLWLALGGIGGDQEFFHADNQNAHRLADIFATRYVLLGPTEPVPPWLHSVFRTPDGTVAINPTALPRAWVAYDWRQAGAQGNSLYLTVASNTNQLRDQPVIERSPPPPKGPAPPGSAARFVSDGNESVTVAATAIRPGYLILLDSAYPGWTASLDGRSVPWLPANENFRAVAIPAGRHLVTFRYQPASVLVGTIVTVISVISLIVLAVIGAALVRRRRRAEPQSLEPQPAI